MPGWLMAGGLIAWFVGWRKHADFSSLKAGRVTYNAALFNHHLPQRNMYGWYQYLAVIDYCRHRCTAFGTKKLGSIGSDLGASIKGFKKQ